MRLTLPFLLHLLEFPEFLGDADVHIGPKLFKRSRSSRQVFKKVSVSASLKMSAFGAFAGLLLFKGHPGPLGVLRGTDGWAKRRLEEPATATLVAAAEAGREAACAPGLAATLEEAGREVTFAPAWCAATLARNAQRHNNATSTAA